MKVPYRKFISLKGEVEEWDGSRHEVEIPYYGRNSLSMKYDLNKVEPYLETEKENLVTVTKVGLATIKVMNAGSAYDRLKEILKEQPNLVLIDT